MGTQWQLQEAENRFDEIAEEALTKGPQTVTRHGLPIVVIMSAPEYHKITLTINTLVEFLQNSPLAEVELNIYRDKDKYAAQAARLPKDFRDGVCDWSKDGVEQQGLQGLWLKF
ncbi:MAG: type II toxin-antitoxin system prevent-host-death family antitoxin [Gammaproteobacteria bacterium]|nr:type II toxin-antitoxin system prevent-host-death family antitoxin [Gammaproteobacteria bacterium]